MSLARPRLVPTVFPDAAVADAVAELRRTASWLASTVAQRERWVDADLDAWVGGFRARFDLDSAADRTAAGALVEELRRTADALDAAADEAAVLRQRRAAAHRSAVEAWQRDRAARDRAQGSSTPT